MKTDAFNFHKFIDLQIDLWGTVTFNGHQSLFNALKQVYPNFCSLSFSEQMGIIGEATMALTVPPIDDISTNGAEAAATTVTFPPKEFWYDFEWTVDQHLIIKVYEPDSGNLLYLGDGTDLITKRQIENEFDVEGVRMFLVRIGELLPGDSLVMSG